MTRAMRRRRELHENSERHNTIGRTEHNQWFTAKQLENQFSDYDTAEETPTHLDAHILSLFIRHADRFTGVAAALSTCVVVFCADKPVAVFGVCGGVTTTKDEADWV